MFVKKILIWLHSLIFIFLMVRNIFSTFELKLRNIISELIYHLIHKILWNGKKPNIKFVSIQIHRKIFIFLSVHYLLICFCVENKYGTSENIEFQLKADVMCHFTSLDHSIAYSSSHFCFWCLDKEKIMNLCHHVIYMYLRYIFLRSISKMILNFQHQIMIFIGVFHLALNIIINIWIKQKKRKKRMVGIFV